MVVGVEVARSAWEPIPAQLMFTTAPGELVVVVVEPMTWWVVHGCVSPVGEVAPMGSADAAPKEFLRRR